MPRMRFSHDLASPESILSKAENSNPEISANPRISESDENTEILQLGFDSEEAYSRIKARSLASPLSIILEKYFLERNSCL